MLFLYDIPFRRKSQLDIGNPAVYNKLYFFFDSVSAGKEGSEMQVVNVRNLTIGRGRPAVCIPLTPSCEEELAVQLVCAVQSPADMWEWRMDYLPSSAPFDRICAKIREAAGDRPLLATFRTRTEGGMRVFSAEEYLRTYDAAIRSGADLADVEWSLGPEILHAVKETVSSRHVPVVVSRHYFDRTPSVQEMLDVLQGMDDTDGDISKLAVMPQTAQDVLDLMEASARFGASGPRKPYITLSMGSLGRVTRLACDITGSSITFAAAYAASAPGQMSAESVSAFLSSGAIQTERKENRR